MITVPAAKLLSLDDVPGWELVNVVVGSADDPLVLLRERPIEIPPDPQEIEFPGIAAARRRARGPSRHRIVHHRADGVATLDLAATRWDYHWVQPLPGGEYVVTSCQSDRRPNADIYAGDGQFVRSWHAGGCTTHLQSTKPGLIWAGYGDQDVLGSEIASNGAACFDSKGRFLVGFNQLAEREGVGDILDCDAMNVVADQEAWFGYDMNFALARVVEGRIDGYWDALQEKVPISGSKAFAIAGDRLLFQGGHDFRNRFPDEYDDDDPYEYDHRSRFYLVSLDGENSQEVVITAADDASLGEFKAFGRGSKLYLRTKRALLVVDAAELPAS